MLVLKIYLTIELIRLFFQRAKVERTTKTTRKVIWMSDAELTSTGAGGSTKHWLK